jgi:GT2 family glycosyltransferase
MGLTEDHEVGISAAIGSAVEASESAAWASAAVGGAGAGAVRISVAIPVWNDAEWLAGAIESVLSQAYPAWELVIGDNASEQDLGQVVARYADPRIRHHRFATHVGVAENHNRTMALCRYEWVQLLSADDRLRPGCLEQLAARIAAAGGQAGRLVMVVGACRRVDPQGQPTDIVRQDRVSYRPVRMQVIADGLYDAAGWLRANAAPGLRPWMIGSVAIARDLLLEVGGLRPDMGLCQDLELTMRVAAYGQVAYIGEPLLDYTVRGDSMTGVLLRRHVRQGSHMVDVGAAWLSALQAHQARRWVAPGERAAIFGAIARAFLRRAILQAMAPEGHGRLWALMDVLAAVWYSPPSVLGTWRLGVALAAVLAPRWLIERGTIIGHRFGLTVG